MLDGNWNALVETAWQSTQSRRLDAGRLTGLETIEDGERLQLAVLDRWVMAGEKRAGWKVGQTSGDNRDAFGPGVRAFGYLLASRIFPGGASIALDRIRQPGIETELCFRIGSRLVGADVTASDARKAAAAVMPAFEINEDRIEGRAIPAVRIADDLRQWGIVLGKPVPVPPVSFDWDSVASGISVDGSVPDMVSANGHIDDHFQSLASLARELSKFGLALEENDIVITGAYAKHRITGPCRLDGTFTGIGDVSVSFV